MQVLERERCLADLSDWLDAAAEHGGIVALVAGEAGIGKTTLLQQFAPAATQGVARALGRVRRAVYAAPAGAAA